MQNIERVLHQSEKVFTCHKSTVYRGVWKKWPVAIKHIPRRFCVMDPFGTSIESNAMVLFQECRHVVKHVETIYNPEDVYILMDWIHGKNLKEVLDMRMRPQIQQEPFTEQKVKYILYQVAEFLKMCNERGFIYGDIKLENIMLRPTQTIQVIDFGCTRPIHTMCKCYMGTPIYFPPEMFEKVFLPAYDVWGLGILAYYLACGNHPFIKGPYGSHDFHTVRATVTEKEMLFEDAVWNAWTKEGKELVYHMLQKDPYLRPTIHHVYNHAWFENIQMPLV